MGMHDWTFYCWSCLNQTAMVDKVMRSDTCPHCGHDMHSCKNCQHYDFNAHNQCRELVSIYVPDKEKANFCTVYLAHEGAHEVSEDADLAKARLEALFSK